MSLFFIAFICLSILFFIFLWRYLKTNIYETRVNDIDDLKDRIKREMKAIKKKQTLDNVFNGIVKRLNFIAM